MLRHRLQMRRALPGRLNERQQVSERIKLGRSFVRWRGAILALGLGILAACTPVGSQHPDWPEATRKWYERANASYRAVDFEDAAKAIEQALKNDPEIPEVRLLAAKIALAELNYDGALGYARELPGAEASGLRARAHWYSGRIAEAAAELEQVVADPDVRDAWAEGVLELARQGQGRRPFTKTGDLLAVMEMPRLNARAMLVPVELNGQPVLAMLSTGQAEVVLDSAGGRQPSWVSLRFGGRVEVKDVPALTKDLSGISRELNAPVKLLLGTHLLRHLNATFDFRGRQFVVRNYEPPAPPLATRVPITYVRGGGIVLRSQIGIDDQAPYFSLFMDTGSQLPVALDASAWERTSIEPSELAPVRGSGGLKQARLSEIRLGAFGIPSVPAMSGVKFDELESTLGIELDGLIGAGVLGEFRITLSEQGKALWVEDMPPQSALPVGPVEPGVAPPVESNEPFDVAG